MTQKSVYGTYTYDISSHMTDFQDQLHYASLFSLMQESAALHATKGGWGAAFMHKIGAGWLLLRASVRLQSFPSWHNKLTVKTWSRGANGPYFYRDFLFYDAAGTCIGQAGSTWLTIDLISRRPMRPKQLLSAVSFPETDVRALPFDPPRIKPQPTDRVMQRIDDAYPSLIKHADYSDIDHNMHVNNTRYVAWCLDGAHQRSLMTPHIDGIDINFLSEISFGKKVHIYRSTNPNGCLQIEGCDMETGKTYFSSYLHQR